MTRLERFAKLLEQYQQSPSDYDEGEEEDPRPYLNGEAELARFVCVTVNYSSHGSAKYFFLPTFEELDAAQLRAEEFEHDSIFEEIPVAVVDLDTGDSWEPKRVEWTKVA